MARPGPQFFRLNGWDWGLAIAALTLIGGIFFWGLSLLIDNKMNQVRVDFARLEERIANQVANVQADIARNKDEIAGIVQAGMQERTDEIQRALLAGIRGDETWFYVQVANVPAQSDAYSSLVSFAAAFDKPKMMQIGDKAAFEFWVPNLDDPKAATLQALLERVKGTGIETSITIAPPPTQ